MSDTPHEPQEADAGSLDPKRLLAWIMGITLAFPLVCAFAAAISDDFQFPAIPALLSFGAFAGVLIYVFVDPMTDSKITVGGITLGGAAALMFVFPFFFHEDLNEQMNGPTSEPESKALVEKYRGDARVAQAQRDAAQQKNATLQENIARLKQDLARKSDVPVAGQIISQLEDATPSSDLGRNVLELAKNGRGPFKRTEEKIRVSFNSKIREGTYRACEYADNPFQERLELGRVKEGDPVGKISLDQGDSFGPGCNDYSYQLSVGCDAAKALLIPDIEQAGCDAAGGVRWVEGMTRRKFELSAARDPLAQSAQ